MQYIHRKANMYKWSKVTVAWTKNVFWLNFCCTTYQNDWKLIDFARLQCSLHLKDATITPFTRKAGYTYIESLKIEIGEIWNPLKLIYEELRVCIVGGGWFHLYSHINDTALPLRDITQSRCHTEVEGLLLNRKVATSAVTPFLMEVSPHILQWCFLFWGEGVLIFSLKSSHQWRMEIHK